MSNIETQNKILSALRNSQTDANGHANLYSGIPTNEDMEAVSAYINSSDASTLRSIYLRVNKDLGKLEKICLAFASSQYCKLESLNLGGTGVGSMESIRAIGEYLISPSSSLLTHLNLYGNKWIGDQGGEKICIALTLSQYCKLQCLNLGFSEIGSNSIKEVAKYLISPSSSNLSFLNLSGNPKIGINEVKILCSALSHNSTLLSLDLTSCGFDDRGALVLHYLLSNYNSSISAIALDNGNIDENFRIRISRIKRKYETCNRLCRVVGVTSTLLVSSGN